MVCHSLCVRNCMETMETSMGFTYFTYNIIPPCNYLLYHNRQYVYNCVCPCVSYVWAICVLCVSYVCIMCLLCVCVMCVLCVCYVCVKCALCVNHVWTFSSSFHRCCFRLFLCVDWCVVLECMGRSECWKWRGSWIERRVKRERKWRERGSE